MKRLAIPALLIGAAGIGVGVIAMLPSAKTEKPPQPVPPVPVRVLTIVAEPNRLDTVTLTAVVEPYRVVQVAAEVAGRVERWGTREHELKLPDGTVRPAGSTLVEGEPVAAGAPLVLLNAELLQASRDRAQAQLEYDQRELDRVQELFQRGSVSARELDDARTRRAVSAATCAEETRQLERTKIVAPVAGVLNDMKVEVGEYAMAGKIVAEIVEVERVKVVVDVPERDIGRLHVGDGAAVVLPDDEVEGHITYISALADTQTRTTRVEITVDNRAGKLRSGQIVRARLTRNVLHDVIMIPLASVIPLEEGRLVYVVVDGKAQRRDVELGFMQGLDVQVVRGLQPGAQLIIDGQRYVGPDQTVTIVP